mgnify:CR=1 FL=1
MAAAPGLIPPTSRAWHRFDGPARLVGIDLARGLAVLGMLAAHLLTIDSFVLDDPDTWLDVVNGRSSILFATLAGVSIALVTGGARPSTGPARARAAARLALRGALLWGIGILLVLTGVPVYVILPAYALLFALSLPFLGLRAGRLLLAAVIVAAVMPWVYPFLDAAPIWGGLRGGISIALALSLPAGQEKDILVTATYIVVLFSVLAQGSTINSVIARTRPPGAGSSGGSDAIVGEYCADGDVPGVYAALRVATEHVDL